MTYFSLLDKITRQHYNNTGQTFFVVRQFIKQMVIPPKYSFRRLILHGSFEGYEHVSYKILWYLRTKTAMHLALVKQFAQRDTTYPLGGVGRDTTYPLGGKRHYIAPWGGGKRHYIAPLNKSWK